MTFKPQLGYDSIKKGKQKMSINIEIGDKMKKTRNEYKITQEKVAEKLSMSTRNYKKIEQGHSNISAKFLTEFSELFGVEPGYFFRKLCDDNREAIISEINTVLTNWENDKLKALLKTIK